MLDVLILQQRPPRDSGGLIKLEFNFKLKLQKKKGEQNHIPNCFSSLKYTFTLSPMFLISTLIKRLLENFNFTKKKIFIHKEFTKERENLMFNICIQYMC